MIAVDIVIGVVDGFVMLSSSNIALTKSQWTNTVWLVRCVVVQMHVASRLHFDQYYYCTGLIKAMQNPMMWITSDWV